jgi:hypothetical protein
MFLDARLDNQVANFFSLRSMNAKRLALTVDVQQQQQTFHGASLWL